jgi:predicted Zn-dependent peptidase
MKQEYKKVILDNGVKIVAHRMPTMKSAALGIWIKAGGRHESTDFKGVFHFLEHLAFKGTKEYSCRKLKESIEGIGGSLNGFTSEELTCYLVKIPTGYIKLAFDILADMVINPILAPEDIEKERTVILEEIKMYKDLPQIYVYELLDELLWPKQPLGMPVSGTVESMHRIKREDLISFKNNYYTSSNMVISAAGNLEHRKFIDMVKDTFSSLGSKKVNNFVDAQEEYNRPQLKLLHKETEQTHLALGFYSLKRDHPLKHALALLHIILGANMSSRLFNELREKRGLAYEIGTQVKRFYDTGAFIVHAGIDNRKVIEAIELILNELKNIRDKSVSNDEFKRAKEFYVGQLTLALEDTLDNMLWMGESLATLDKIYTLESIIKELRKTIREDIREVARIIFREESLSLALIGPLKDNEGQIFQTLSLN